MPHPVLCGSHFLVGGFRVPSFTIRYAIRPTCCYRWCLIGYLGGPLGLWKGLWMGGVPRQTSGSARAPVRTRLAAGCAAPPQPAPATHTHQNIYIYTPRFQSLNNRSLTSRLEKAGPRSPTVKRRQCCRRKCLLARVITRAHQTTPLTRKQHPSENTAHQTGTPIRKHHSPKRNSHEKTIPIKRDTIFIELVTSDRKFKATREGS